MMDTLTKLLTSFFLILTSAYTITPQEYLCPTVHVECASTPCCNSPFEFVAHVSGQRPPMLSYAWTVSVGRIISGQGTASIKVDSKPRETVTATVEITGPDPKCPRVASITPHCDAPPPIRLFDQYWNVSLAKEKSRLDRFALQLQNEPTSRGYILAVGYGRAQRAKRYLVGHHGIEPDRIVALEKRNARGKLLIKLFMVPAGAVPPKF